MRLVVGVKWWFFLLFFFAHYSRVVVPDVVSVALYSPACGDGRVFVVREGLYSLMSFLFLLARSLLFFSFLPLFIFPPLGFVTHFKHSNLDLQPFHPL